MKSDKERLAIFDWDGVIVDSAPFYLEIYRQICLEYNREFPVKDLEEFREWYDSEWENNFIRLGFSLKDMPEILALEGNLVDYSVIGVYADMKAILPEMKREFELAIASTTPSYIIEKKLESEDMRDLFAFISGGEDGVSEKKTKILKVIDYFDIAPERCVMIGDTIMDITSARDLGVKSIAISCGWNSKGRLAKAFPDLIIDSHEEILLAVKKIFRDAQ